MGCIITALVTFWSFWNSWDGEREIVSLDKPTTFQIKADRPESGITIRIEGKLKGSARVVLPQYKQTFLLPEHLNTEFCVDSVFGPYTVEYIPDAAPDGKLRIKWDFIYGSS